MFLAHKRGIEILGGEVTSQEGPRLSWTQFLLVGVGLLALGAVGVWLARRGGRQGYELR